MNTRKIAVVFAVTFVALTFSACASPKSKNGFIEMVRIPAGTFTMGSPITEPDREDNETQHSVTLSAFWMGKYEVTQGQYQAVMGTNPSEFITATAGENPARRPVEQVSWYDAIVFCNMLSIREGLSPAYSINGNTNPAAWGTVPTNSWDDTWDDVQVVPGSNGYRLPTEAQWEYACRAGTTGPFNFSNGAGWGTSQITTDQANFDGTELLYNGSPMGIVRERTIPVGSFAANAWGLYDMHGNVAEWCWDCYGEYPSGTQTDPTGAASGGYAYRLIRGGSWFSYGEFSRSAFRSLDDPYGGNDGLGFRLVCP